MQKKLRFVEVFAPFETKSRFFVPIGERFGDQLQAAKDNNFTDIRPKKVSTDA